MFPTKKVQSLVGSKIQVEMKGSPRYVLEGTLNSVDEYLNLHLLETVELIGGEKTRSLGSVILRGNNIILRAVRVEMSVDRVAVRDRQIRPHKPRSAAGPALDAAVHKPDPADRRTSRSHDHID
jgi:small nuclear ribonucleoprotein (snRNP)-like protein